MDRRPSRRQVMEWAEDTLRIRRTCPRSLALHGEQATAVWAGVLDDLHGREGLRGFALLDEDRLRELLFSRLPAQGIPAGQVLGIVEELGELANETRRLGLATDDELSRARRVLEAVGADARRASAVATAIARTTGAYAANWSSIRDLRQEDFSRLEDCESYVVVALDGGTIRLESTSGRRLDVDAGRWAAARTRVGDRFFLEVRDEQGTARLVRIAAVSPLATGSPAPDPRSLPDSLREDGVVRLRVRLSWDHGVWCDLELLGSQTLDHLHDAIQDAFGWDRDHLYLFRLGRTSRDSEDDYLCADCEDGLHYADATLASLGLRRGRSFWYLFDFGDRLWHDIKVLRVGAPEVGVTYPRVTSSGGESPDQYGIR